MTITVYPVRADVIYRATLAGGREVEIHLVVDPVAATIADAWSRLTRIHRDVDPMSLEIEIRRTTPWSLIRN